MRRVGKGIPPRKTRPRASRGRPRQAPISSASADAKIGAKSEIGITPVAERLLEHALLAIGAEVERQLKEQALTDASLRSILEGRRGFQIVGVTMLETAAAGLLDGREQT
jgi:hypothetical protein